MAFEKKAIFFLFFFFSK